MTTEVTDALMALQKATDATIEQTTASQELMIEVVDKMSAIDSRVEISVNHLFDRLRILDVMPVSGSENHLVLTSTDDNGAVLSLTDYQEFRFIASATNTDTMTVTIDGLAPMAISNIVDANQVYAGALVTLFYLDGGLYLREQINPKTGHMVEDIGKLIIDTTDVLNRGEVALDGADLSRTTHAIAWQKIRATSNLIDQATKDADPITYGGYYGAGDGENTFTLPIVGGEFIRMFDDGRGVDTDREFGSWQESDNKSHGHYVGLAESTLGIIQANQTVNSSGNNAVYSHYRYGKGSTYSHYTDEDTVRAIEAGGDESRPRSIAYYAKTRL